MHGIITIIKRICRLTECFTIFSLFPSIVSQPSESICGFWVQRNVMRKKILRSLLLFSSHCTILLCAVWRLFITMKICIRFGAHTTALVREAIYRRQTIGQGICGFCIVCENVRWNKDKRKIDENASSSNDKAACWVCWMQMWMRWWSINVERIRFVCVCEATFTMDGSFESQYKMMLICVHRSVVRTQQIFAS